MEDRRWVYGIIGILVVILALILIFHPFGISLTGKTVDTTPRVYLLYASTGSMAQLLNTGQIDSFYIWEPVVANAQLAGIGKVIATPADLPPPGSWANTSSCVLVLRNDLIQDDPDLAALISALTTAAINRTNENQTLAVQITSDWVYGKGQILTPSGELSPVDVENLSFENLVFTADADIPYSGLVNSLVQKEGTGTYNPATTVNSSVYERGLAFLNGSATPRVSGNVPTISIGYLPSSDNFAPLYVMVQDSQYFCDKYGFCVVPDNPKETRPSKCTLQVNGTTVAKIVLVPGSSGGGLMTTVGQNALEGTYVGSVPAEQQIVLGNPSSIIQSINTEGTGLVVGNNAPCNDWNSYVTWLNDRSRQGKPVVIATVQSSIQEDTIREALAYENISVIMYGTDFETSYA